MKVLSKPFTRPNLQQSKRQPVNPAGASLKCGHLMTSDEFDVP
jgi:hypothetical protein